MPKLDDLKAGALEAWSPAQQAALYQLYLTKQDEADEAVKIKRYDERKAKEGKPNPVMPDKVQAGILIDDLVSTLPLCPDRVHVRYCD
jgi:hypothetical protein